MRPLDCNRNAILITMIIRNKNKTSDASNERMVMKMEGDDEDNRKRSVEVHAAIKQVREQRTLLRLLVPSIWSLMPDKALWSGKSREAYTC
ncbi:hypothetical protein Trydic_g3195 [Trypoxylus dichotomus]